MAVGSSGSSAPRGRRPEYAGDDFIIARDGKIAAVYLFFDPLPWRRGRPESNEQACREAVIVWRGRRVALVRHEDPAISSSAFSSARRRAKSMIVTAAFSTSKVAG
jgi:hypothetical protein